MTLSPQGEPSPLITATDLQARLSHSNLRIIDARFDLSRPEAGRAAWTDARIAGAHYAHLDEDLSDHTRPPSEGRHPLPDARRFARRLASWGIAPSTPVVVYDASSGAMAAARFWWLLRWMGHRDVRVLNGGFAAWCAAGRPVVGSGLLHDSTSLHAPKVGESSDVDAAWQPGSAPVADALQMASLAEGWVSVDARAPERFRGELEPLDVRAGHIPGALNRPFSANLADGLFKPVDRLREEWSALLPVGAKPLLYCGSGVTACHNALALVAAGWPMPALYAPSWSGWVSDPSRSIVTGD